MFISELIKVVHYCGEAFARVFLMTGNDDVSCQSIVIVMGRAHRCALFGAEFVDFGRGNQVKKLIDDFHCQSGVVDFEIERFDWERGG